MPLTFCRPSKLAGVPIGQDTDGKKVTIELAHQSRAGKPVYLELDRESAGTRRLLLVLNLAFRALDEGVPLVIDELDASLHTLASAAVLQLFCSPYTNPRGAQLIATAHDTNLRDPELLRRGTLRRPHLGPWHAEIGDRDGGRRT